MAKNKKTWLKVKINSPEKILWQGLAFAVSSTNSKGKFDILPHHANFVTIIENKPIRIRTKDGQLKEFKFESALIHTKDNNVAIYTHL